MGLKVNFSKNEAESTPREVPPSGEYSCTVFEITERSVKPGSTNAGKPFWNIDFLVVDDEKYGGNHLYSNIMLFKTEKDGSLRQLSHFLKALGYEIPTGTFELPEIEHILGKSINVTGVKKAAGYDQRAGRDLPDRFEVKNYKTPKSVFKSGNSAVLP